MKVILWPIRKRFLIRGNRNRFFPVYPFSPVIARIASFPLFRCMFLFAFGTAIGKG